MTSYERSPEVDALLREHGSLEGLAEQLGQHEHHHEAARILKSAANDNTPNSRGDMFLVMLMLVIIGAAILAAFQ
jgi:hypothetical protein